MRISDWSSDVCSSDLLPVLQALLASPAAPVSLAVDHKERYDDDDMKVELDGSRLLDIGKKLPPERVQGESIGMLYFRGEGPRRFVAALERSEVRRGGKGWVSTCRSRW